jgi:hypothetical protein
MNLEQRVQALELEVQVLKSEIQATLLDIREQLLNNTYPALRGDESSPASGSAPSQPAVARPPDSSNPSVPTAANVRQVSLRDIEAPDTAEATEQRVASVYSAPPEVTALPLRPINGSSDPYTSEIPGDPPVRSRPHSDDRGISREQRHAAEPEASALPFLTSMDDSPPFIPQSELLTEADWASLALLESWTSRQVQESGARRTRELIQMYAVQGRFDARIRDALLQLVTIVSEDGELPTALPGTRAPTRSATDSQTAAQGDLPPQNMILKLIAGVQNAGTHTGRRKKRG